MSVLFGGDSHVGADGSLSVSSEARGLTDPCPVHGKKHFLYDVCGPCVHSDCLRAMLEFWGRTEEHGITFRWAAREVDSLRSWVCAFGVSSLGADPASPASWRRALEQYKQHKLKEKAREYMLPEVDLLMERMAQSNGNPHRGHWSVYPDSGLFVKEVIQEVANQTSVCAAAYLLGVISLNDLASLEYEGNRIEAAGSIRRLLDHLKDWMAIE